MRSESADQRHMMKLLVHASLALLLLAAAAEAARARPIDEMPGAHGDRYSKASRKIAQESATKTAARFEGKIQIEEDCIGTGSINGCFARYVDIQRGIVCYEFRGNALGCATVAR